MLTLGSLYFPFFGMSVPLPKSYVLDEWLVSMLLDQILTTAIYGWEITNYFPFLKKKLDLDHGQRAKHAKCGQRSNTEYGRLNIR